MVVGAPSVGDVRQGRLDISSRPSLRSPREPSRAATGLLALQRQAGNRAVTRAIAAHRSLSRAPSDDPLIPPPSEKPNWEPQDPGALTVTERNIIRDDTVSQIDTAFPLFLDALRAVVQSIHAEEKADADLAAPALDVFFGIGAPIFTKLLLSRGGVTAKLSSKLSKTLSTTNTPQHRKAAAEAVEAAAKVEPAAEAAERARELADELAAAKRAAENAAKGTKNSAKAATAIDARRKWKQARQAADAAERHAGETKSAAAAAADAHGKLDPIALIRDEELLKEGMKAGGKYVSAEMKRRATQLFGEDMTDAVAGALKTEVAKGVTQLKRDIILDRNNSPDRPGANFTDTQLLALWAAYDENAADYAEYVATIKHYFDEYARYVKPWTKVIGPVPRQFEKMTPERHREVYKPPADEAYEIRYGAHPPTVKERSAEPETADATNPAFVLHHPE